MHILKRILSFIQAETNGQQTMNNNIVNAVMNEKSDCQNNNYLVSVGTKPMKAGGVDPITTTTDYHNTPDSQSNNNQKTKAIRPKRKDAISTTSISTTQPPTTAASSPNNTIDVPLHAYYSKLLRFKQEIELIFSTYPYLY